jgi:hypothetical protein
MEGETRPGPCDARRQYLTRSCRRLTSAMQHIFCSDTQHPLRAMRIVPNRQEPACNAMHGPDRGCSRGDRTGLEVLYSNIKIVDNVWQA